MSRAFGCRPDASCVPYAGSYSKAEMSKPFAAMVENWKMDETFKFAPTEFKADGNTVTMTAVIDCFTKAGKPIKGTEVHTAIVAPNADGVLQIKSWDVTQGSHHVEAFKQ